MVLGEPPQQLRPPRGLRGRRRRRAARSSTPPCDIGDLGADLGPSPPRTRGRRAAPAGPPSSSAAASSPSGIRSISTRIHDSRTPSPRAASASPSATGRTSECAGDVADDVEERVHHQVHVVQVAGERHRQRVDEERHVVDDHLDDGVPAGPPAGRSARGEDPDPAGALRAGAGEPAAPGEGPAHVDGGAARDVLGGYVALVGADRRVDRRRAVARRPASRPGRPRWPR